MKERTRASLEVYGIRTRAKAKAIVWTLGILAVLLGAYNLFGPYVADVAPFRPYLEVLPFVRFVADRRYFVGTDIFVMVVGAMAVWFID